jgi:hypothetical protein
MKVAKFLVAAFVTLFIIVFSTSAQSFLDESSGNPIYTRVPDSVMIVDIQLKNNLPTIKKITIKQGRYNERRQGFRHIPPTEPLTKPQLFLLDSSQKVIFNTEFEFPKTITIPPAPPGTYDPYTPSVIPIEEPEVSIVVPHFTEASFAEVILPGIPNQKTIKQIDQTEERRDGSFLMPVPSPAEEGSFHLLVMASDYDSSNMSGFTAVANSIENFVLLKEPFFSYSPMTEIHIFSNTADLGCYSGCAGIDRLICCDPSMVVSAAVSSGDLYDEIIVVHNTDVYGGGGYRESGTAYKTNSYNTFAVTYAGSWHKEVALHEFGHSFGNLCDEYSYTTEGYSYSDCVNCRPSCSDWSPILDDCQLGCDARNDYYRPEDSIMFSLSYPDFNEVSIKAPYFPDGLEERLQYFVGDTLSPMPNPMTWGTPPYQTGTGSISMVATTATDPTTPINYYFDFVDSPTGGLGGFDSAWQSGTTYANSGLQANHQYGYRVKARDGLNNETGFSTPIRYVYTAIEIPTGITFGTVTSTSIEVGSASTPSGLTRGSSGLMVENQTKGTNSGWRKSIDFWASGSLMANTNYGFRAKARNGDGVETAYCSSASKYTLTNGPGVASLSIVTPACIRASWTANGNPAGTEYFCENVTAGTNSGWTTSLSWDSCGLTQGVSYSFRVKARNGEWIETNWTSLGSQTLSGIVLQLPVNGQVFNSSSLITKYQSSFGWTESGTITRCTILFSASSTDFTTPIAKGSVSGTKDSWTPSISLWKKLMSASNNSGVIRDIYWKVIGTLPNRLTVESQVWSLRIDPPQEVAIISPANGAPFPSGVPPTFDWQTNNNVKFKLEISSLEDFSDPKKIKGFNYATKDPNVETTLTKTLSSFQWTAVKKLIGIGTGYSRIKAWDGIKRESVSEVRWFSIE